MRDFNVIGVMSGTSLDGVDLVYVNFTYYNKWNFKIINAKTYKYEDKWIRILRNISSKEILNIKNIDEEYSKKLAEIIEHFLNEFSIKNIDFISSHGHTAVHDPSNSLTYQIGNLSLLSKKLNQNVICDFRVQDVELGGQGAPLVPVGEKFLFQEYNSFINLGGFANISKYKDSKLIAYDICPVNIILNKLSKKIGYEYDDKGLLALSGKKIKNLLSDLNRLTFYSDKAPKSLGIEWVNEKINPLIDKYSHHPIEDLLNTCTYHIAEKITNEIGCSDKVLFSGGGVYNEFLMNTIKSDSNTEIVIPSPQIIEFKEALIFAFLGVLRYLNIDNCYSSVTGASKNHCSGKIFFTKV